MDVPNVLRSSCANLEPVSLQDIVSCQKGIKAYISSAEQPPALRTKCDNDARQCDRRSSSSHRYPELLLSRKI